MSPRTAEQFEEMREKSRDKIVFAALELFGVDGFHATSVSKIAKHAGVSKGLIYNYFESKEEILKAILDDFMQEGDALFREAMSPDPLVMLENIIRLVFKLLKHDTERYRLITSLSFQVGKFPYVKKLAEGKAKGYTELAKNLMAAAGFDDPEREAKLFGVIMDGVAFQYISVGDLVNLDEMEAYLIEKYCHHEQK